MWHNMKKWWKKSLRWNIKILQKSQQQNLEEGRRRRTRKRRLRGKWDKECRQKDWWWKTKWIKIKDKRRSIGNANKKIVIIQLWRYNPETLVGALEWNFIIQRAFKTVFVSCMDGTTTFAIAIVSDVTNTLDDTACQLLGFLCILCSF